MVVVLVFVLVVELVVVLVNFQCDRARKCVHLPDKLSVNLLSIFSCLFSLHSPPLSVFDAHIVKM